MDSKVCECLASGMRLVVVNMSYSQQNQHAEVAGELGKSYSLFHKLY